MVDAQRGLIARALAHVRKDGGHMAVEALVNFVLPFVIFNYAERPLTRMPKIILDDLAQSQVSIFAATTLTGELGSRIEMTAVINKNGIRHGHMVNINRQIMVEGMRADFIAIDALSANKSTRAIRELFI